MNPARPRSILAAAELVSVALQPGEILHDRYQVVRNISSGGMGTVFEARDLKLASSPCAIKELHDAARSGSDSGYIQGRFEEEMKALASLEHPSIPRVRDFLQDGDRRFLVMDFVRGDSLEQECRARLAEGTRASAEAVALDAMRLLDTLAYLHEQVPPVVHRDLKPANILRDGANGGIKLVDFGLARAVAGDHTQTVVGTMGYCAPEQLMGKAEPRSDLYSLGVTMLHLLTGTTPEMDLFEPRRHPLPGVKPGLGAIIERATQPRPDDRFANARDMQAALHLWLQGDAVSSMPLTQGSPAAPQPVARPLSAPATTTPASRWLVPAGGGVAALGLAVWLFSPAPATPHRTPPTRPVAMQTPAFLATPGSAAAASAVTVTTATVVTATVVTETEIVRELEPVPVPAPAPPFEGRLRARRPGNGGDAPAAAVGQQPQVIAPSLGDPNGNYPIRREADVPRMPAAAAAPLSPVDEPPTVASPAWQEPRLERGSSGMGQRYRMAGRRLGRNWRRY